MEKNVFVTGATGRLGRAIVHSLCQNGWHVTALVRDAQKARQLLPKAVELVKADLKTASLDVLAEGIRGKKVVHAAGLLDVQATDAELHEANVEATRRVVQAAMAVRAPKIVHVSSTAIYHKPKKLPIDEKQEPTPVSPYGQTKLEAEEIVRQSGVPYVILRPCAIYGPGFDAGFTQVAAWVKKRKMPIIGSGKNRIPLVHVKDVVQAVVLALEKPVQNEAFIVTSGEILTQEECLKAVAKALDAPAPQKHVPLAAAYALVAADFFRSLASGKRRLFKSYVDFLVQDRTFDISKARKGLCYRPAVGLESGVTEWLKPGPRTSGLK